MACPSTVGGESGLFYRVVCGNGSRQGKVGQTRAQKTQNLERMRKTLPFGLWKYS